MFSSSVTSPIPFEQPSTTAVMTTTSTVVTSSVSQITSVTETSVSSSDRLILGAESLDHHMDPHISPTHSPQSDSRGNLVPTSALDDTQLSRNPYARTAVDDSLSYIEARSSHPLNTYVELPATAFRNSYYNLMPGTSAAIQNGVLDTLTGTDNASVRERTITTVCTNNLMVDNRTTVTQNSDTSSNFSISSLFLELSASRSLDKIEKLASNLQKSSQSPVLETETLDETCNSLLQETRTIRNIFNELITLARTDSINYNPTFVDTRPHTRQRGPVRDYPNILERPLEYSLRRRRHPLTSSNWNSEGFI